MSGTDAERISDIEEAFCDNDVKAIIIGVNFTNTNTTSSGWNQNLNFQIYQKEMSH